MARRGARNKYDTLVKPYLTEISAKVRQGITEAEIAKSLGISVASLSNYKNKYPEFAEALSKDKGADVLQSLVNAGIEAAKGYYRDIETTVLVPDENGNPTIKQKTIQKQWYPPNAALHKFYVLNFGKEQGYVNDPLEFELKRTKQAFDQAYARQENWDIDFDK